MFKQKLFVLKEFLAGKILVRLRAEQTKRGGEYEKTPQNLNGSVLFLLCFGFFFFLFGDFCFFLIFGSILNLFLLILHKSLTY